MGLGLGGLASVRRELSDQRRNAGVARSGDPASRLVARGRARTGAVRSQDIATELGRIERAMEQLAGELDAAGQQLDFVAAELRDQVMKLRMVPIGRTWSKYHRTVREIAHRLGKQVRLELVGGETELDKVLVEQLDDPFLHLVRNAIDHGIEPPDRRTGVGKTPEGMLRLAAGYRGNQVIIRIEDDGKGIDVERVRQKAVETGLVPAAEAASLDEAQVYDLIFRAGFSTAGAVSDMSGRGVGMDVVRETISQLKGTVVVDSTPGKGTRFEIRLPLTLAIVQVLLLRCAGETYAIPIDLVERTVSARPEQIRFAATSEVLYDSGRDLPLVRLRDVLGLPSAAGHQPDEEAVVLVDVGGQTYGLACDGFVGRQEIVIKSLGSLLARVPGAAGATLVGDRCVLILDVPALVQMDAHAPIGPLLRAADDAAHGAPRILVAEDSDVIRESIRRVLLAAGYHVEAARDGAEALRIASAAEIAFDLVSTDVVMPEMDGYELTRRLRAIPGYRDVPIVMVTSKAERIDRIRGFDAGVDAYLTKPTDAAELLRVITRHLRPKDG
jgi:chemotaxis protein histidine kinase CheA